MCCGQNMVMLGSTETAEYAGSTSGSKDARAFWSLVSRLSSINVPAKALLSDRSQAFNPFAVQESACRKSCWLASRIRRTGSAMPLFDPCRLPPHSARSGFLLLMFHVMFGLCGWSRAGVDFEIEENMRGNVQSSFILASLDVCLPRKAAGLQHRQGQRDDDHHDHHDEHHDGHDQHDHDGHDHSGNRCEGPRMPGRPAPRFGFLVISCSECGVGPLERRRTRPRELWREG